MSTKAKTRKARTGRLPLRGIRVLVGRARHQASALSSELRRRGAKVIAIPFIEIQKPKSFQPLDAALKNLNTYDWLILTSVNGVEAMWDRMQKIGAEHDFGHSVNPSHSASALASGKPVLRIAAIGPATRKAIERHGAEVDVVPTEYVAEAVVRSLQNKVRGKRVLLVRARVARDVIPRELRKAGAHVDVVEAYETVIPRSSRARLRAVLRDPKTHPHVVTFTSSSAVRNFEELLAPSRNARARETMLANIRTASIGPVTSATLRELRLPVDIAAKEFTIPGLVQAIEAAFATGD
jgi:uroporphyrinogen-III synthase